MNSENAPATAPVPHEPIAVVGLACRLPGAEAPQEFWRLLLSGLDSITEVPDDRWGTGGLPDAQERGSVPRRGGYLDSVDGFDAEFFGVSPREAAAMDPQQRLMLELAWETLEDASVLPAALLGSATGVFVGAIGDDYARLQQHGGADAITRHTLTGLNKGIIANRVSYVLGLTGPSLTVDTGQSSSLVAVHMACESLRRGESELALAGGVSLNLVPESTVGAARFGALSPDGLCYTFDSRANGYVRGEGGGAVLLKPLSKAAADGDRVYAVIRGSAVNNDGATPGLTVPGVDGQRSVLRAAYANAGIRPREVHYVELHGTGTPVGDPVEAQALGEVLGADRETGHPILVGSAKTNVGHLEGGAGIVGLVKTVLSLHQQVIPASLNFENPNPNIHLDEWNLRVQTEPSPWPESDSGSVAGVSSFGMGGTNCHVVLSGAPEPKRSEESRDSVTGPFVWALSARGESGVRGQAERLASWVRERPDVDLAGVGLSLGTARTAFGRRAAVVGSGREDLLRGLAALAEGAGDAAGVVSGSPVDGGLALVFSGQGSQRAGVGRGLYKAFPVFAQAFDRVCAVLDPLVGRSLSELVFAEAGTVEAGLLDRTGFTQPALFAFETALFRLLESWGVVPDVVMGHSVGEISAAHVAGVLSLEDACVLVAARAGLMEALPEGGAMVAVEGTEVEVAEVLSGVDGPVGVGAVNGPNSVVVSGEAALCEQVADVFSGRGRRVKGLRVSHAFHSPLVEPVLAEFARVVEGLEFAPARIPVVSNVSGALSGGEVSSPGYWVRHVREAVRFADGVVAARGVGVGCFVEVGPGTVLSGLVQGVLAAEEVEPSVASVPTRCRTAVVPSVRGDDEAVSAVSVLGRLFTAGVGVDWAALYPGAVGVRDLPTYAFQHDSYWLQATRPDTREPEERLFWEAIVQGDAGAVSGGLGLPPDERGALRRLLPYFADWHKRVIGDDAIARTAASAPLTRSHDAESRQLPGREVEERAASLRERLHTLAGEAADALVLDTVRRLAADALGFASTDDVDVEEALADAGLSSFTALELRNDLAATTGLELPPLVAYDHPTPLALTRYLRDELEAALPVEKARV
ncbi:acyltransferase domain-containing protein [Nocardiopsis exhalans]|uniref:Acyltransferase domain-containing protein n=1 Tax=Nocardiopsis exhalans TaxID=163604 RepID=A0ABY5D5Q4_9ACTN|nr:type I polyketide synthase [Nocardiopsis exhalans]USY18418.1 acyltransferase domain-containing protein [Nocardiopsis exhalans]